MAKLKIVTAKGTRLEKLKALAALLADSIDNCGSYTALPQLARQYRETIREIEEIEGAMDNGDEISKILAERQADGKPGAVRKNRTPLQIV